MATIIPEEVTLDFTNGIPYMLDPSMVRISNITPFTYRDGLTYLEVLEAMRDRDSDIVDAINSGLSSLSTDYNDKITSLLSDVAKEMGQYSDLPTVIDNRASEIQSDLTEKFRIFANNIDALVKRKFSSTDIDVYNWLKGETTNIQVALNDMHNRYTVHGFMAGDFDRMGLSAETIDGWPLTISMMEMEGKMFTEYLNPLWAYSPVDGVKKELRRVIYDVFESTLTGQGNVTTFALSEFDSMPMSDTDNLLAA